MSNQDRRADVQGTIAGFVVERFLFGEGQVDPGQDLVADGVIDSMGIIQLIAFLKERFGVEVRTADITMENFSSVEKAAAYVRNALR